jgi:hypothetical protein
MLQTNKKVSVANNKRHDSAFIFHIFFRSLEFCPSVIIFGIFLGMILTYLLPFSKKKKKKRKETCSVSR